MTALHSASSWQSSDGSDPVTVYARDVVEGRVPAGQWHKAACARHLRDLETAEAQGLVWKPWLGWKVVLFARLCRHFKGRKWAGQPVHLEPWEVFIVGSIFGWVRVKDGFRRFVDAFIEVPRGQGKALAVETPIPTPTGWTAHGDLRPGDYVLSPAGTPVLVQAVTPHHTGPCYAVRTSDGAEVIAHARHEWRTYRSNDPLPLVETETVAQLLDVTAPLELPGVLLPVYPYMLGRRTIVAAAPVGEQVVNCIQVEGGEYLAGRHFLPTHNSTLAAIIVLYMTFFDGEPGADSYCYATKKDQARIVFRTARRFVTSSPLLKKMITPWRSTLTNEETESKVEILGSDSDNQDGLRPHCAVADEVHKQKTPDMMEVVESGMGTLDQPLHFKITTAGESAESVYEQQVRISTQVLDGTVDIPEWFAFIAAADPDDDPESEATWRKANPNYGISVNPDFLRKEARKAKANPYEWVKFRRLYLGQKVGAADGYLPLVDWDICVSAPRVDVEVLRALPCWLGLDLSSRVDLTAAVLVWVLPDGRAVWRPKFWVPEVGLEERRRRDRVPFTAWAQDGHLETTEGNVVHLGVVRQWIAEQKDVWPQLQEVCYDPWGAGELVQDLKDDHGMRVVEVRQGPRTLNEPMKRVQELVLEHALDPSDNPVLRWNASNLKARVDSNENVAPCKRKSRGRIDGMTAGITAMSRALLQPVRKKSRYSDPNARVEAVRIGY